MLIAKRVAFAFGWVMVIDSIICFRDDIWLPLIPAIAREIFMDLSVLVVPTIIFLVALYDSPQASSASGRPLRMANVGAMTVAAFFLAFVSMFAFLAFGIVASIVFGFPLRG